jgi:hypothetical protein
MVIKLVVLASLRSTSCTESRLISLNNQATMMAYLLSMIKLRTWHRQPSPTGYTSSRDDGSQIDCQGSQINC